MLFSSLVFITVFLLLCVIGYFLLPGIVPRNWWLAAASLFFYAWGEPAFLLVMVASITLNYLGARLIDSSSGRKKRSWLIAALIINLGLLLVFKYADFIVGNINAMFSLQLPLPGLPLPLGISFFTFQALSYVIDVYRGRVQVQRNFTYMLLYISFFPQLIAGPIVRYQTIEAQILGRSCSVDQFSQGLRRFIVGLAKKVLIANQLAEMVDGIYAALGPQSPVLSMWLLAFGYGLQIFFDFSGYSDMAIGLGRMFGFEFPENFNYPYIAKTVAEFWRRWHISLGTWFRDYVYFPLGGSRVRRMVEIRNLLIVWLLTGLWHGASWNFILWGLYFCVFIIIEKLFLADFLAEKPVLSHIYLLLVVLFGWVLFRADTLGDAMQIYRLMFGLAGNPLWDSQTLISLRDSWYIIVMAVLLSTPLLARLGQRLQQRFPRGELIIRPALLIVLLLVVIMFLVNSSYNPFIYFRF